MVNKGLIISIFVLLSIFSLIFVSYYYKITKTNNEESSDDSMMADDDSNIQQQECWKWKMRGTDTNITIVESAVLSALNSISNNPQEPFWLYDDDNYCYSYLTIVKNTEVDINEE